MSFLRFLSEGFVKYVVKNGLNAVAFGVPVGDIVTEVWENYRKKGQTEAQIRDEVQRLAQDPQMKLHITQTIAETAKSQPADVQLALGLYLEQVQGTIRRSLRSPQDPTGRTIPSGLTLRKATDLLRFIPDRMPRFRPGDRPIHGSDLVLDSLLGTGGFGEVWKARHEDRPEHPPVALKFCTDAAAIASLRNEVRLLDRVANQVRSERGIVQLLDANLRAEPPFLKYEYVEGGDLGGLILEYHRHNMATWENVAKLMHRLATIVGVAHARDIVHRDLKPDNVLTQRTTGAVELKVADFGIGGVVAGQEIKKWDKTRMAVEGLDGAYTPIYASPQQRNANPATPQDDVYSLGVIWYQALTGDLSREPPTGGGWRKRFLEQGMPQPLVELLESCIDADPADRPANAQVLAQRLSALLAPPAAQAVPVQQAAAARPAGAKKRETAVRVVLSGAGGDRGADHIQVYLDGAHLGDGCAASGFDFRAPVQPGNHTVELHGHKLVKFLLLGERKQNETKTVYPLAVTEPGEYEMSFGYGFFVRGSGVPVPNIMTATHTGADGQPKVISKKTMWPGRYVGAIIGLSCPVLLALICGGGLLFQGCGKSRIKSSDVSLSFREYSVTMAPGETKDIRLRVSRFSYGSEKGTLNVELTGPSALTFPKSVEVEAGEEEVKISVIAQREGEFSITAKVKGAADYSSSKCTIKVSQGGGSKDFPLPPKKERP